MSLLRLAARNLWRSPRRTVLTVVAIVAGVAISNIGRGFIAGVDESIIVAATDSTVGHVLARPTGYPTENQQRPIDALLTVNAQARALLDQEAEAWTQRTYFAPLLAHGRDALRVIAISYDPERDPAVFPRTHWKVQGRMPTPGARELALTPRIARILNVSLGDTVVLQVKTHRGAINALEVAVSGIVRTGNPAIDGWTALVPSTLGSELIATDLPSHLSVRLGDRDRSTQLAERLAQALGPQAEVVTWQSESAELLALQQVRRQALDMVVFVLMALAAFGIANTILMAAHERVREIGTLRSMGMTESGVLRLFVLEGALLGLVGGVLGALAGGGLVAWWATHPLDFSEIYEKQVQASISASTLIYAQFSAVGALASIALGALVAVVASIYPARVAARMVPAEAVRASS